MTQSSVPPSARNPAAPAPSAATQAYLEAETAAMLRRSKAMRQSLGALLDQVQGSRSALPHLAALEVSLSRQGIVGIDTLSATVLTKICNQLESLPLPKDDRPLQALLLLLMDALESLQPPRAYPSEFMTDSRLMVEEASFTDFAAAGGDFAKTQPGRL